MTRRLLTALALIVSALAARSLVASGQAGEAQCVWLDASGCCYAPCDCERYACPCLLIITEQQ